MNKMVKVKIILISALCLFFLSQNAVARVEIPEGATVASATLSIEPYWDIIRTVNVHRVTGEWSEYEVTWNTKPAYDLNIENSFISTSGSVDLTNLVQGWVDGTYANYGVLLEHDTFDYTIYNSSESATVISRPKLEICYYTDNPADITCVVIQRQGWAQEDVADTYIWSMYPDTNKGGSNNLYTGLMGNTIKQALIRFYFDLVSLPASLGDFVWEDVNANGIQDANESGFPYVTVNLYSCDGAFMDSAATDETGLYMFSNLAPGSYSLEFIWVWLFCDDLE